MHKTVFYNGDFAEADEARIAAVSAACMYGKGVFTTIAVYDSRIHLWEKHSRRLMADAARLGIGFDKSLQELTEHALSKLIEKNQVKNGRARITLFEESPGGVWAEAPGRTGLLIVTAEFRSKPDLFRITISPYQVNTASPLKGIKSINYLEHLMSFAEAKTRGFHEAIRLNERSEAASVCMANMFWLRDERLFTPGLETGCLAGTTREFILENLQC